MLAVIGLYAVIAHAVTQRTREIGLRVGMGASRSDIARLVLAQGIRPLAPGVAILLPLALAVTRLLRVVLVGVSPSDRLTFAGIVLVLTIAAALGCAVPAARNESRSDDGAEIRVRWYRPCRGVPAHGIW